MSPMLQNKRPQWPSILTVFRPIEEYWSASGLARSFGPDPERVLDPFDALLMHLVLDVTPTAPCWSTWRPRPRAGRAAWSA